MRYIYCEVKKTQWKFAVIALVAAAACRRENARIESDDVVGGGGEEFGMTVRRGSGEE